MGTDDKLEETIAAITEVIEQTERRCRRVAAALEKSRARIREFDERLRRERLLNSHKSLTGRTNASRDPSR